MERSEKKSYVVIPLTINVKEYITLLHVVNSITMLGMLSIRVSTLVLLKVWLLIDIKINTTLPFQFSKPS